MFFHKKQTQQDKNSPKKQQTNFEEKWQILENGVKKLFDFIDSDLKKPFNYQEHAILYSVLHKISEVTFLEQFIICVLKKLIQEN